MAHVLVNGPASWNMLVSVAQLPDGRPQTVFATGHRRTLGGTSAGKALTLARLGVQVTLRTALGDDDDARHIRTALEHPQIRLIAPPAHGTSEHHVNLMADDGGRLSVYLDLPPDPGPPTSAVHEALRTADAVVLDLAQHSRELIPLARAAHVPLWCDVHDYDGEGEFHRDFVEAADVLVLSGAQLDDPESYLAQRVAAGTRWAVCTQGARGAVGFGRDEGRWVVDAVPSGDVVDANGAGDAFVAGMLAAHLHGLPLDTALRWGAAAGSLAVRSAELASPEISSDQVERLAELAIVRRATR